MKLVSIIIPAYNSEKFLHKAIESSINQTYNNIEIIIVNDGSTDDTLKIANNYKAMDSRITVLSQSNKGLPAARNAGLAIATGEFIQFLDSDDHLELDAVETCIDAFEDNDDISFILYGFNVYSSTALLRTPNPGNVIYKSKDDFAKFKKIDCLMPSACNKLFRRSYIKYLFETERRFAEDLIFNFSNFDEHTNIKAIEHCLYNVQLNTVGSINKRYVKGQLSDCIRACETRSTKLTKIFGESFDNRLSTDVSSVGKMLFRAATRLPYDEFLHELETAFSLPYFSTVSNSRKDGNIFYRILFSITSKRLFRLARIYCKIGKFVTTIIKK